jgi:hypothetical protein
MKMKFLRAGLEGETMNCKCRIRGVAGPSITRFDLASPPKRLPKAVAGAVAGALFAIAISAPPATAFAQSQPDAARASKPPAGLASGPSLQRGPSARSAAVSCTFTLTNPNSSSTFTAGQSTTINWTGCPPTWKVNLTLVDYDAWTSVGTFANNLQNGGSYTWTLPQNLACNRRYEFYIAEAANQTWSYGPVFRLKCNIEVTKERVGSTYKITLRNVGPGNIVPLLNAGSQQTNSVPIFNFSDALPAGTSLTAGSGTGPGVWQVPGGNITGPFNFNFRFTSPATIAPGQVIGVYTFNINSAGKNCVNETMRVSDQVNGGNMTPIQDPVPGNNTNRCES